MDIRFQGEDQARESLHENVGSQIEFAKRMLLGWMNVDKDDSFNKSYLPPRTAIVAFTMSVKACRQIRTVIELCERGEAADATTIARSMFETACVIEFVLVPTLDPAIDKNGGDAKMSPYIRERELEFRAGLYLAHLTLDECRSIQRFLKKNPTSQLLLEAKEGNQKELDRHRKFLGADIVQILNKSMSFSGIKSKQQLSISLGGDFAEWHDYAYSDQSSHVHAVDAHHFLRIDDESNRTPNWFSPASENSDAIHAGSIMFLLATKALHSHMDFGKDMSFFLDTFETELGIQFGST